MVFAIAPSARADEFSFSFSGGSIKQFRHVHRFTDVGPGVDEITGIGGTFADASQDISGAITGLYTPVSYSVPPALQPLASLKTTYSIREEIPPTTVQTIRFTAAISTPHLGPPRQTPLLFHHFNWKNLSLVVPPSLYSLRQRLTVLTPRVARRSIASKCRTGLIGNPDFAPNLTVIQSVPHQRQGIHAPGLQSIEVASHTTRVSHIYKNPDSPNWSRYITRLSIGLP